jgi:hypothetical protein
MNYLISANDINELCHLQSELSVNGVVAQTLISHSVH